MRGSMLNKFLAVLIIFILFVSVSIMFAPTASADAVDLYWFGGTGNWSDINHWATATNGGGVTPHAAPLITNRVFFDANSFNAAGQVVTVDVPSACGGMDWTDQDDNATFAGGDVLVVNGSLTYIPAMIITYNGQMFIQGTAGTQNIITAGHSLGHQIRSYMAGGTRVLLDNFTTSQGVFPISGTLDTNGFTVNCGLFDDRGDASAKTLTLGASVINCTQWDFSTGGLTLTPNTATINVSGTGAFRGGDIATYHDVFLNGTAHTITGSNTFNSLNLPSGTTQTITFTDGTTQTVTTTNLSGSLGHVHILKGSAAAGWNITKVAGTVNADYISISRSTAAGGAIFNANGSSINGGNNVGWIFTLTATTQAATGVSIGINEIPTVDLLYTSGIVSVSPNLLRNLWVENDIMYLAQQTENLLSVWDVHNLLAPVQIGSVAIATGPLNIIKRGDYLYVTSDSRIYIVNVSVPAAPVVSGFVTDLVNLSGSHGSYLYGNYLYVAAYSGNRFTVVDISNPLAPTVISSITDATLNGIHDIVVDYPYAYVATHNGPLGVNRGCIVNINISNPLIPVIVASNSVTDIQFSHIIKVGNYVFAGGPGLGVTSGFCSFNVSNPLVAPVLSDSVTGGGYWIDTLDHYAYVVTGGWDLTVVDIFDPTNMAVVGQWSKTGITNLRNVFIDGQTLFTTFEDVGVGGKFYIFDISTGVVQGVFNGTSVDMGGVSDTVWFEYGLTAPAYGDETSHVTKATTGTFSAIMPTTLTPGQTYHYRAVINNGIVDSFGGDQSFTLTMPTITTGGYGVPGTKTAYLSANVPTFGIATSAFVYFEWGYDLTYGNTTSQSTIIGTGDVTLPITGYNPSHEVFYRAVVETGGKVYGSGRFFTVGGMAAGRDILQKIVLIAIALGMILGCIMVILKRDIELINLVSFIALMAIAYFVIVSIIGLI